MKPTIELNGALFFRVQLNLLYTVRYIYRFTNKEDSASCFSSILFMISFSSVCVTVVHFSFNDNIILSYEYKMNVFW